jgi:hypothetical protein
MKFLRFVFTLIFLTGVPADIYSQKTPPESPRTTLKQTIGLGEIILEYSRPSVKGRKIFGQLVPFGQVWRTGADQPTWFSTTDTVSFDGSTTRLLPGKYALYCIPTSDSSTVIFSKNTELWGAYGYKPEEDALRFRVKTDTAATFLETMNIQLDQCLNESMTVIVHWERFKISFRISINLFDRMFALLQQKFSRNTNPTWQSYWTAARFLYNHHRELPQALKWIDNSIMIKKTSENYWMKALICAEFKNYTQAISYGENAVRIGKVPENSPYFPYEPVYTSQVAKWKKELTQK